MLKPSYGAGILFWSVDDEGRLSVLLGKRFSRHGRDAWSIPGGKWEKRDGSRDGKIALHHLLTSALRETYEETGVDLRKQAIVEGFSEKLSFLICERLPFFVYAVFSCRLSPDVPLFPQPGELTELVWFDVGSLPGHLNIFIPSQVRLLKKKVSQWQSEGMPVL